ncbi:hypothetical protein [Nitrospirillum amazonense]|uniref:hypothetical protein n=1 Tax=Nitrospirillum amazonense TaxID=28077 RepID=UPI002412C20B|nr:hypothetical protein [Nitrospirillum amazonense]MDG3444550.1 hypothetical protein [Nitrospirillum amazonense]
MGLPPHREPETQAEREIAMAMVLIRQAYDQIRETFPALPPTAVSVGLINVGTQLSVDQVGAQRAADYLRGCAALIAPMN